MVAAWNDRDGDDGGEQDGSLVEEQTWRIDVVRAGATRARAFTSLASAARAFQAIACDLELSGTAGDVQLVAPGGHVLARWTVLAVLALALLLVGCGGTASKTDAAADDSGATLDALPDVGQDAGPDAVQFVDAGAIDAAADGPVDASPDVPAWCCNYAQATPACQGVVLCAAASCDVDAGTCLYLAGNCAASGTIVTCPSS